MCWSLLVICMLKNKKFVKQIRKEWTLFLVLLLLLVEAGMILLHIELVLLTATMILLLEAKTLIKNKKEKDRLGMALSTIGLGLISSTLVVHGKKPVAQLG